MIGAPCECHEETPKTIIGGDNTKIERPFTARKFCTSICLKFYTQNLRCNANRQEVYCLREVRIMGMPALLLPEHEWDNLSAILASTGVAVTSELWPARRFVSEEDAKRGDIITFFCPFDNGVTIHVTCHQAKRYGFEGIVVVIQPDHGGKFFPPRGAKPLIDKIETIFREHGAVDLPPHDQLPFVD